MQKLINLLRNNLFIFLVIILVVPTFYKMLSPGIYSMQDFHFFRLLEFDKCVQSLQIPCRWAPDAGLGYGEPLFNFYGQVPYIIGEVYHLMGGTIIDSIKLLFIVSLLGSGLAMFYLARKIWGNNYSALISSIIYVYAPYRAVDVWVRAALPEALAFILFPLIILSIEKKSLKGFSVLLALLVLTHNLSLIMFMPILVAWIIYRKYWSAFYGFIFALLISAFYVLPVMFESKYIDLASTIHGYFDYRAHFVTLGQIFFSRFWGYGGSTWGDGDGLNLSIGQIQWMLPIIIAVFLIYHSIKTKSIKSTVRNPFYSTFILLFSVGLFYIFLTHNKSTILWTHIPQMAYIQFPWRFYGVATFCLALASGVIIKFFDKQKITVTTLIILSAIFLNYNFFRGDIWYKVDDSYFTTGEEWTRQRTASIGDYWPQFGHSIPSIPGDGKYINYFPGWVSKTPPKDGLIPSEGAFFTDTPIRRLGNIISLTAIFVFVVIFVKNKKWKRDI